MILLSELTPKQRAAITNGCGPKSWKGHTWKGWLLALLAWAFQDLDAICRQHDVDYWVGGTEQDREAANERGRQAIFALGAHRGQLKADLAKAEGDAFYEMTQRLGAKYFHPSPQRTPADLKA